MVDPWTPIIPYRVENICIERTLLDLGANINMLLGFFYDVFQLDELNSIPMTIQLVDWSVKIPKDILEDMLLQVEEFILLMDFIVLDMEGVDVEN